MSAKVVVFANAVSVFKKSLSLALSIFDFKSLDNEIRGGTAVLKESIGSYRIAKKLCSDKFWLYSNSTYPS